MGQAQTIVFVTGDAIGGQTREFLKASPLAARGQTASRRGIDGKGARGGASLREGKIFGSRASPEKSSQKWVKYGKQGQTVLHVSNDARFCAARRRDLDSTALRVRAASVSSVAAARHILEEDSPGVILLEEDAVAGSAVESAETRPSLQAVVVPRTGGGHRACGEAQRTRRPDRSRRS